MQLPTLTRSFILVVQLALTCSTATQQAWNHKWLSARQEAVLSLGLPLQRYSVPKRRLMQASGGTGGDLAQHISTSGLRVLVNDTHTYPYNSVGLLKMWRADDSLLQGCTGVLIDPTHVLTAAHCLWNSGIH